MGYVTVYLPHTCFCIHLSKHSFRVSKCDKLFYYTCLAKLRISVRKVFFSKFPECFKYFVRYICIRYISINYIIDSPTPWTVTSRRLIKKNIYIILTPNFGNYVLSHDVSFFMFWTQNRVASKFQVTWSSYRGSDRCWMDNFVKMFLCSRYVPIDTNLADVVILFPFVFVPTTYSPFFLSRQFVLMRTVCFILVNYCFPTWIQGHT